MKAPGSGWLLSNKECSAWAGRWVWNPSPAPEAGFGLNSRCPTRHRLCPRTTACLMSRNLLSGRGKFEYLALNPDGLSAHPSICAMRRMNRLGSTGNSPIGWFFLVLSLFSLRAQDFARDQTQFLRAQSLATNICSQCHLFAEPQALDRATWREQVKPLMRKLMGVAALENDPSTNARVLIREWNAIWNDYYLPAAPEKALPQDPREPIVPDLALFNVED